MGECGPFFVREEMRECIGKIVSLPKNAVFCRTVNILPSTDKKPLITDE
jgi:hypothetical protein